MMRWFSHILFLLVALFGVTFAMLNAEPVFINYYLGQTKLPLSLLLLSSFALGLLLGLSAALFKRYQLRRENAKLTQRLKFVEQESSSSSA